MAKIVKRKIRWVPSGDADVVGYKVYWVVGGGDIDYESPDVKVFPASQTEVIVPDDIAELTSVDDNVTIGVSSFDDIGNESDVTSVTVPFDFIAPASPTDLSVESFF